MSELRPRSEIVPTEWKSGHRGISKIERYGLGVLVLKLRHDNIGPVDIAEACNEELKSRSDGKTYYRIEHDNVQNFVNKFYKQRYKSFLEQHKAEVEEYEDPITMVHKFCQQIKLEMQYAQNNRGPDGAAINEEKLARIMGLFNEALNTMGNLYSKITPAFNVLLFRANVRAFNSTTQARTDINDSQKEQTLLDIRQTLLTDHFMASLRSQIPVDD